MALLSSELPVRTQDSVHGIYGIQCVPSGRWYVGSSFYLWKRIAQHRGDLRRGEHHSIILQRSYDKYGEAAFEVTVLEECAHKDLHSREEYWMGVLHARHPTLGMNIASPDRHDRTWTSKMFRVRKVGAAVWQEITNLAAWAYSLGFEPCGFFNVAAGKMSHSHGWEVRRLRQTEEEWRALRMSYIRPTSTLGADGRCVLKGRVRTRYDITVTAPDGSVQKFDTIHQLARALKADRANIYLALRKGWKVKGHVVTKEDYHE